MNRNVLTTELQIAKISSTFPLTVRQVAHPQHQTKQLQFILSSFLNLGVEIIEVTKRKSETKQCNMYFDVSVSHVHRFTLYSTAMIAVYIGFVYRQDNKAFKFVKIIMSSFDKNK